MEWIFNEFIVVVLVYGFDCSVVKWVLVFDFGGGIFDVLLLCIVNGVFDVKVINGDM